MSKRSYVVYLKDVLTCTEKILRFTQGKSFQDFVSDEILTDAVARNLEIIGEAVKNIPASVRRKYPDVDWKKIAGLRDILAHEYFSIHYVILWDIITNKVPELKDQVEAILQQEQL
jgi:uncharacterized protein with HEPN domain